MILCPLVIDEEKEAAGAQRGQSWDSNLGLRIPNPGASPSLPPLCLSATAPICSPQLLSPACCAFAVFMTVSELGEIALWLCRNKEARR